MLEIVNQLDGFGTYSPLTVAFDRRLDIADLQLRHNGDDDFRNDAVFLLNVDPDCARFGEEIGKSVALGTQSGTSDMRLNNEAPKCLNAVGIIFTYAITYTGFLLLAIGTLWNANIVKKLREIRGQWRALRGSRPVRR